MNQGRITIRSRRREEADSWLQVRFRLLTSARKIHIAAQVFENRRVAAMHQNTSRSFLFSSITCRFAFRMNLQMAYLRRLVNWP